MSRITIDDYCRHLLAFGRRARERVEVTQHSFAEMIRLEVQAGAPVDTGAYRNSIQVGATEWNGSRCTTRVFSALLVGGENEKWATVPLGAFLEWGTGFIGAMTNEQEHGYPYRMTPWSYYNTRYGRWVTTHGMVARPHWLPPVLFHRRDYIELMRRAVRGW